MVLEEMEHTAREYVSTQVARGGHDWFGVVEGVVEHLHGSAEPAEIRRIAVPLAAEAFAAHRAAQDGWPVWTDNDRLTDAFRELDAAGVTAREDFACCRNCGETDLGGNAAYAFYHEQDAERAVRGDGVWIAFGPGVAAGEQVAAALRAEGLYVDWDAVAGQRIHTRVRWARRRHGRMAAYPDRPATRTIPVEVVRGRLPGAGGEYADNELEQVLLPWLPSGVAVRLADGVVVHREFDRLVDDQGRSAGRFHGLRLLDGQPTAAEPEAGLLEVTYEALPDGTRQGDGRPMTAPEARDVLRGMPPRSRSWLCAVSRSERVVQMVYEDGGLWLETPDVARSASVGKYATLDEAERMLAVLAAEDRVAIDELPGVTVKPW
ncbi:hypothetical protein [Actinoplanes sp. NBRC 101535]|uniref:DUF6891 domain-containing protein n=1 Tax=Actinoplanes sp. NBRC 101535 TaxID=3032196 RepID=UPI0024A47068|nr:hypothetical protein [Actinoplanes sp. NBRC 101535]GLY02057.1 hypothetical protein Acsp01_24360 [Actinoplanes sp. NBRC 101535]